MKPKLVVCLGATAVQAVLQRKLKIAEERGKILKEGAPPKLVTIHPSAIVRIRERAYRDEAFGQLVSDLAVAQKFVA